MPVHGNVEYSQPRAVPIREDNNFVNPKTHTAIHGTINIVSDTQEGLDKILAGWPEIMSAVNLKVREIVGRA